VRLLLFGLGPLALLFPMMYLCPLSTVLARRLRAPPRLLLLSLVAVPGGLIPLDLVALGVIPLGAVAWVCRRAARFGVRARICRHVRRCRVRACGGRRRGAHGCGVSLCGVREHLGVRLWRDVRPRRTSCVR
jgi:hypothetical protein